MKISANNSSFPIFHLLVKYDYKESECEKFEITVNNDDQSRDSACELTESFTLNVKESPIKSENFVFKESPIPYYIAEIVHERIPEAYDISLPSLSMATVWRQPLLMGSRSSKDMTKCPSMAY